METDKESNFIKKEYDRFFELHNNLVRIKNSLLNNEGLYDNESLYEEEEKNDNPNEENLEYIKLRFDNLQNK